MPPRTGPDASRWLYKQADVLLGPVEHEQVVEMLFAGELDGKTPIARHGSELAFQPLGALEVFRLPLAKAEARLRVEAQSAAQTRSERKRGLARILATAVAVGIALFLAGRAAYWLAIHRPWERSIQIPEPTIVDELPQVRLASARTFDDELVYPEAKAGAAAHPAKVARGGREKSNGAHLAQRPGATAAAVASRPADTDDLQSLQLWDQEAINGVVRAGKVSLHACLAAEARRQKGDWEARIPIEFSIGNDGRVSRLWIDNPDYKSEGTELFKCMFAELRKWRFPAYGGEQASVSLAFSVKGR